MIPVSEELKRAYLKGTQKYLTLTFSDGTVLDGVGQDGMIDEGSMTLEQTICDDEQIKFGLCNAASFSVNVFANMHRYKGLFVYPVLSADGYTMALGKFKVEEDRLTDDRSYRQLKCYDQMTDLMTDDVSGWYDGLNLPMTLRAFRDSLFMYFYSKYGVQQAPVVIDGVASALPNDSMIIQRTIDSTTTITGQEVLQRICEINGCFGVINEEGKFEYRFLTFQESLYPADDLYPANDLYPIGAAETIGGSPDNPEESVIQSSLVWEEYNYQPITKLQIHQTENDVGVIVGVDGNMYEVYDNFLVYGMSSADLRVVANRLLAILTQTLSYTPGKVAARGRPWIQTGDLLAVYHKGWTITFPLLHRTMSGITALKDEYEAKGQEYFTFDVSSTNHEIHSLRQKTLEIRKDVEGLEVAVTEIGDDLSEAQTAIRVTAEGLESEVSRATTAEGNLSSTISQTATSLTSAINAEVTRAEGAESTLSSNLTQTASSLTSQISAETTRAQGVESSLSSRISQTASEIELYVSNNYVPNTDYTAAQIVAKINNDGSSSVIISADKVNLTGYVTFTNLSASGQTAINGDNITTGSIHDSGNNTVISLLDGSIVAKKFTLESPYLSITEYGVLTSGQTPTTTTYTSGIYGTSTYRTGTQISGETSVMNNGKISVSFFDSDTYTKPFSSDPSRVYYVKDNSRYIEISSGSIKLYAARKTNEYISTIKPYKVVDGESIPSTAKNLEIVTNALYVNQYESDTGSTPIYCGSISAKNGNVSASQNLVAGQNIYADGYLDLNYNNYSGHGIYGVTDIDSASHDGFGASDITINVQGNGLRLWGLDFLEVGTSGGATSTGYDGWLTEYFGPGNGLVLKNGHGCDLRYSHGILVELSEWDW